MKRQMESAVSPTLHLTDNPDLHGDLIVPSAVSAVHDLDRRSRTQAS